MTTTVARRRAPVRRRRRLLPLVAVVVAAVALTMVLAPARRAASNAAGQLVMASIAPFAPEHVELEALEHPTVAVDELPDHVLLAVLAAEDLDFFDHPGINGRAVVRAAVNTVIGGRLEGGSTITQQLAKINYTGGERTLRRKGRELLYTQRLEEQFTKDELLERYVNQVYYGQGSFGIADASRRFFGVRPQQLTVAQAATLSSKLRAPQRLDPWEHPDSVLSIRNEVLAAMARAGWLSDDELERAVAEPIGVVQRRS